MKKCFLIFAFVLFFALIGKTQDYKIHNYDSESGLHNIATKTIAQDSYGFIWIATDNGLSRYDGIEFKAFITGLPSNYIKGLFKGKNKQLLAISDKGIVEIVSRIDTAYFTPFLKGSDNLSQTELFKPKSIFEDSDGSLWISGEKAIYNYTNKRLKTYSFDKKDASLSYVVSFSIVQDSLGNLFAFSQQGYFYRYDAKSDKFIEINTLGRLPFINGALSIQAGEILLATDNGICIIKYDKSFHFSVTNIMSGISLHCIALKANHTILAGSQLNGLFDLYKLNGSYQFRNIPDIPEKAIKSIFIDRSGNVWLSTDAGIILLNPVFFAFDIKGLKQIGIHDIKQDTDGTIYASNGASVYEFYNDNGRLKANKLFEKSTGIISQVIPFKEKILYSSFGKLEWFEDGKIKTVPSIKDNIDIFVMQKDKFDNIWCCASNIGGIGKLLPNNEIVRYNSEFGNLTNTIISLTQDNDGTLYGGSSTDTAYLFRYDRENDVFNNISVPIKFKHPNDLFINDLAICGKTIYLGSSDGLFMIENGEVSRIPIKGVVDQNVKSVETDKNSNVWIGFESGIVKYNKSRSILFDKKDGLPSNTIIHRNIFIDGNNNIFVGTTTGFAYSFKNNQEPSKTPTPIIISIKFNKNDSSNITNIFEGSYASIHFLSLCYPVKDIKYQTKIVEFDNDWSEEMNSNELFIPKLEKGTYTVYIRALQHGNFEWSEPTVYTFTVKSQWYNTWWAYCIYIILSGLLIFAIVKLNLRRLSKDKENLEAIIKQRTMEVMEQNAEIHAQNEEIHTQNDEMLIQKNEIEKQAMKLREQNSKLQELSEFKQGMSSMIVHDLKNPLNLILNVPKTSDTAKKDKIIQQSGKQMLNMVLNILDVDKYEDMSMNLNLENKQFVLIAFSAIAQVQFLGEQKELTIKNEIEHGLITKVEEEIIERVLVNILTNAIKYTPANGSITLSSKPLSETIVRIEIQDTGEGIPDDKIHLVFKKFGQIVAKKSGGVRSTGLGLTFCKLAVEAHGGEIGFNSEKGKGTTFWFTLGIGRPKNSIAEIIEKENTIEEEEILFTEEEKLILGPIISQLKAFTIYETGDVEEIINQLKPLASGNIQKWLAKISKNLVTLNQKRYLELLKI